jgi:hypothetical protein
MLGSAQCQRCGASLLDGELSSTPAPALPVPQPSVVTAPPAPPPSTPPPPRPGYAPPPPAPPGFLPSPVGSARQQRRQERRNGVAVPKAGCGCLVPLLLLFILPVGGAIFAFASNVGDGSTDGSVQEEGALEIGVPAEGGIGSNETDRWTLDGRQGRFEFAVDAEGDWDPKLEVLAGGITLGSADDTVGRDPRVILDLEEGTDYEVLVTGFGSSSGSYDIEVSSADGPPIDGGTLTVGQSVTDEVPPGRIVRYGFVGTDGDATIVVVGIDNFDPTLRVRTTDGAELDFNDDRSPGDRASLLQLPIAEGQRVVIEVAGFADAGGQYTIVVQ